MVCVVVVLLVLLRYGARRAVVGFVLFCPHLMMDNSTKVIPDGFETKHVTG